MPQAGGQAYRLNLLGPFGLFGPGGRRVEISSKKGMALVALLAMSRDGIRSRPWLQDMLWGSRSHAQGSASLRRELSTLRAQLNAGPAPLLICEHGRVTLMLDAIALDPADSHETPPGEFLEGLDIADADGFEQWLRDQRMALTQRRLETGPPPLPRSIVERPAPAGVGDRPLLAILPFANLTADAANDYVAEGLAADLIDQIARLRWLPVIETAPDMAQQPSRQAIVQVGKTLGVRYLIDGRLRAEAPMLRLGLRIVDAQTGEAVWSHQVRLPADASATALGPVIDEIVGALSTRIDQVEMTRAARAPAAATGVTDLIWRARWHHNHYTPANARTAEELLERALAMEPHSSEALIQLAYFRQRQLWIKRAGEADIAELSALARRAIAADPIDGRGYLIAGITEIWRRNTGAAVALLEQSVRLNPSLAYAYTQLAAANYLADMPERAVEPIHQAFRLALAEQYTFYALGELAMIRAMLGDWAGAVEAADHSIARREAYWYAHLVKVFALSEAGRPADASDAAARLLQVKPRFDAGYVDWVPFLAPRWPERLKAAFQCAVENGP